MTLDELMKLEYELTANYMSNKTAENWEKLLKIREIGQQIEADLEAQDYEVFGENKI
jgi:hypothetical protein